MHRRDAGSVMRDQRDSGPRVTAPHRGTRRNELPYRCPVGRSRCRLPLGGEATSPKEMPAPMAGIRSMDGPPASHDARAVPLMSRAEAFTSRRARMMRSVLAAEGVHIARTGGGATGGFAVQHNRTHAYLRQL